LKPVSQLKISRSNAPNNEPTNSLEISTNVVFIAVFFSSLTNEALLVLTSLCKPTSFLFNNDNQLIINCARAAIGFRSIDYLLRQVSIGQMIIIFLRRPLRTTASIAYRLVFAMRHCPE
jgi:hypothetical protein